MNIHTMNLLTHIHNCRLFYLLFYFSSIVYCVPVSAQETAKCKTIDRLVSAFEELHYAPITYNDESSAAIFTRFMDELDPYHLYLTSEDRDILFLSKYKLDDEVRNRSCNFLHKAVSRYKKGLIRAKQHIAKLEKNAFELSKSDTLVYIPDYSIEDIGTAALHERWRKWLKHKIISRLYSPSTEHPKPYLKSNQELAKNVERIRKAVCEKEIKIINEKIEALKQSSNFVFNSFFNAIAHQYDPHTDFFSISDKQLFESFLSDESLSFGFEFSENKAGDLEIISVIPGGPAWKSNDLHKGDVLQRLQVSEHLEYDLTLVTESKLTTILKSIEQEPVILTVKKISGQLKSITLVKEVISNEENAINSFLLSGEKKMGYISLPTFYTEMENANRLGCANDFAKELIGLNREGIEGLIIDLRSNGGGSVKEALELAGIFIDAGPLFVSRDGDGTLSVLKDPNRGTIYDGPVVVLIDKLSASASEIFASTLQDYDRAVIVGGSSYGKSTGQLILPLLNKEDYKRLKFWDMDSDFGFLKVTTSKFYRISGKTHQLHGVQPDIHLPQLLEGFNFGEATYATALSSDSIQKKLYYTLLPELPISQLKVKSAGRLASHQNFKEIDLAKPLVGKVWGTEAATLHIGLDHYRTYQKQIFELSEKWDKLSERDIADYHVELSAYDQETVAADPQIKAIYDIRKKTLARDIYVEEAFYILMDLIYLK
ncbi:MAG: carboxy terminal-processing peptidase [Flammeovirgaceae bacterium]